MGWSLPGDMVNQGHWAMAGQTLNTSLYLLTSPTLSLMFKLELTIQHLLLKAINYICAVMGLVDNWAWVNATVYSTLPKSKIKSKRYLVENTILLSF